MSRPKRLPKALVAKPEGTKAKTITPRARHLLKKYGITEEQYNELYSKQNGCCAVCGRHASKFKLRLSVDHDHVSREIRGLLCTHCNRYIVGRHRKELGSVLLRRAYEYLTAEYTEWLVPPKVKRRKKHARRKRI